MASETVCSFGCDCWAFHQRMTLVLVDTGDGLAFDYSSQDDGAVAAVAY